MSWVGRSPKNWCDMQFTIKDLSVALEQEDPFMRLTVGSRAYAAATLVDADDLERMSRIFADQARKLRGD